MAFLQTKIARLAIALLFIFAALIFTYLKYNNLSTGLTFLLVAVLFGAYMAINIGANDVANNVGPAVGSGALTLFSALIIAAIFEAMGAIIAGGEVTSTIKSGIIEPTLIPSTDIFLRLMMAALFGGAIWLNLATMIGAPVSTTHSIVGGVLGAGIAAGGWHVAHWESLGRIVASWVISPMLGGIIAASLLLLIKRLIVYREDVLKAAKFWVPILLAFMVWAFSTYLILKGLKHIIEFSFAHAALISLGIAFIAYWLIIPLINRQITQLAKKNNEYGRRLSRKKVSSLFTLPLIAAAALLSFAHGSNDVANAVGPLAAIVSILEGASVTSKAAIPLWVMMLGAFGLSVGLVLFGPKLIKTVGSEITDLNKTRAFCVAMAAALTVIIASQLGLPVSSTHIAVGGVFGVGFLREYLIKDFEETTAKIKLQYKNTEITAEDEKELKKSLRKLRDASIEGRKKILKKMNNKRKQSENSLFTKKEIKKLAKANKRQLVQRKMLLKIAAAWVVTVPASALLSATLFFIIRLF
ncbi:MAG: inorganic phosphate transporter [Alphaproteobacteria bacterium]